MLSDCRFSIMHVVHKSVRCLQRRFVVGSKFAHVLPTHNITHSRILSAVAAVSVCTFYFQRPFSTSSEPKGSLEDWLLQTHALRLVQMNHFDVIKALLPFVQKELGVTNAFDLYASMKALARWQSANRPAKKLPGVAAMPNRCLDRKLIGQAFHILRFATATYGWKGMLFFYMTDTSASYGFGDLPALVRTSVLGDGPSFARLAGIPYESVLYESDSAKLGMPKHYVVADEETKSLVLAIRGTMSLNDAFTDLVTRPIAFANGEAHEGIAHGAHAIYSGTLDVLQHELKKRPGWKLVVTGHSLGAATAILYTILFHYHRDKQLSDGRNALDTVLFHNVEIECHAFAPPPVFAPLSVLPEHTTSSILCWTHNEDIVSRLSFDNIKDLIRILKKISEHEPSMPRRLFSSIDIEKVLESEEQWVHSWTGKQPDVRRIASPVSPAAGADGHDEAALNETPGQGLDSKEMVEGRRFKIPGVLYCFRAPVDIGANDAMRDTTRDSFDGDEGATGAGGHFVTAVKSGISSVASAATTTVGTIASSVVTAAESLRAWLPGAPPASQPQPTASTPEREDGKLADDKESLGREGSDEEEIRLKESVADEAALRAEIEDDPFVTIVSEAHMRSLPLTNRAWRDHVPDMYLNVFRQLKEVAERQSHDSACVSRHHHAAGPSHRHYRVADDAVVKINATEQVIGAAKGVDEVAKGRSERLPTS